MHFNQLFERLSHDGQTVFLSFDPADSKDPYVLGRIELYRQRGLQVRWPDPARPRPRPPAGANDGPVPFDNKAAALAASST